MTYLPDDINDYCFIDTETKALPWTRGTPDESVVDCGAYRYRRCARVMMIQYAIGDGPVRVLAWHDFDETRRFIWADGLMPDDLMEFYHRAREGDAFFAAWNMNFDRLMLNTISGCDIQPEMTIDVMGQALASNMPGKLEGASRFIGRTGKQQDGKALIKMFCGADWHENTPLTMPAEWADFKSYGARDIDELRAAFKATRKLPRREWEEYWVSERINDRGMAVDAEFCDRAAAVAQMNRARLDAEIEALTEGTITKVTQRERVANWLYDHCELAEARDKLVKAWTEEDNVTGEEDDALVPSKLSVAEDRLRAYINFWEALDEKEGLTDEEFELLQIAQARLFGASSTPGKFQKIVDMHDDGSLCGQYSWNGAQQTGRFSSRGVQVHNLISASLSDKEHPERELDAIDFINQLELDYAD